jgi:pantoate--beta-alanine ligase
MVNGFSFAEADYPDLLPVAGSIGFVPTMGALHAGHLALVRRALAENDAVVVSIFVNPLQFGVGEDFEAYPRPLDADKALLESLKADNLTLYLPRAEALYPAGFATSVRVAGVSEELCGATRAGHFDGVCTVLSLLCHQVRPKRLYLGEKDFQQLAVVRRMVLDLAMPWQVVGVPTVREADGLAMSSRNRYLTAQERATAPMLYATLHSCMAAIKAGQAIEEALAGARQQLLQAGFARVDYISYCDSITLKPLSERRNAARLLAAAQLGKARLIDNIAAV